MVSFQIPYFNAYFTSHVDGWMKEIACIQKGQQRNIQKQRSPGSIYTGIIKNTYRSTFGSYIKELHVLIQKYWQLISTKQLWSVPNIVSSKSRTVQYRRNKTVRHPLKKTVRHPLKKTVRAPVEKDSSAPRHFGTRWKKVSNLHRIFFQTIVITFFKIKSTKIKKNHQWSLKSNQNIIYLNIL